MGQRAAHPTQRMLVTLETLHTILGKAEITEKDPASFDPDVPLREQGLDSLDMATLVFFVETELDLSIPHQQYKLLTSLSEIAAAINTNRQEWSHKP